MQRGRVQLECEPVYLVDKFHKINKLKYGVRRAKERGERVVDNHMVSSAVLWIAADRC